MKRKLSPPPPTNKILRVYLYRNTNTTGWKFRITVVVVFFLMKRKLSPPPPDKQNTPGILYRNTNTTGWKFRITVVVVFFLMKRKLSPPPPTNKILRVYYIGIPSTCTEDVLYIQNKKMKRKLSPPPRQTKYSGYTIYKYQYNRLKVPDYSSSSLFLNEEEAIPPPPDKQNTPGILYRNTNT